MTKRELEQIIRNEEKKLGVGSAKFTQRHQEIMDQCDRLISDRKEKTMKKQVLTAKDISEICGISVSKAYQIIRQLNEELKKSGYLTFAGRVSTTYFNERMYGMGERENDMDSHTGR